MNTLREHKHILDERRKRLIQYQDAYLARKRLRQLVIITCELAIILGAILIYNLLK